MGAAERLDAARRVSLYLVSLVAAASADLAWRPPSPLRVLVQATVLALAVLLGGPLAEALSSVGGAGARRRARLVVFLLVPLPSLFALLTIWAAPRLAGEAAVVLVALQVGILLLADTLKLELLALANALVFVLGAAAGGGLPAAVALSGFLVLTGVFLALDHTARRLSLWPNLAPPPLGLVLKDAVRLLAAPVLLLVLALSVLPEQAPAAAEEGVGWLSASAAQRAEARRAYVWLVLVALAGAGVTMLSLRWFRGRGRDAPPLVEMAESHVEAEEVIEPPAFDDARYAPARGRVIRAYLRFLARAREAGFRLGTHLTPREIESRVRRPEGPLGFLTMLFMDARYGPDEPVAADVDRAEAASRAVCSSLRVLPRTARRALDVPSTRTPS